MAVEKQRNSFLQDCHFAYVIIYIILLLLLYVYSYETENEDKKEVREGKCRNVVDTSFIHDVHKKY